MPTIQTELQSLSPSALVELFELDMTNLPGGQIERFHAGTNTLTQPVVWQGNTYMAAPIEVEGFDVTTKGALPRPKIRIANVGGAFSALAMENDDLVGCKIIRKRTYARFLDAVNFPGGVNPEADPQQRLKDDLWFVEQKLSENRYVIEWELSSAFDLQGVMLPYRQVLQNSCPWRYRGPECGYAGPYLDKNDKSCSRSNDFCSKRFSNCRARFGFDVLPFGGFPGAVRVNVTGN